jgi:hypothetical protein
MDAVISSGAMVQKPCSQYYVNTQQYVLSGGSSPTPYPPKPPTPPPKPTYQSCNDWGVRVVSVIVKPDLACIQEPFLGFVTMMSVLTSE